MVEEEIVEAETNTETDFPSNITTSDLNKDNETVSDSSNSERFVFNIQ